MATPPRYPEDRDPERYLLVVRAETDEGDGFLLLRRGEDGPDELLAIDPPRPSETLEEVAGDALRMRTSLAPTDAPQLVALRVPARMARPRAGAHGVGWRCAVAVRARGELDLRPPLTSARLLPLDEATAALATDAERSLLRAGAELLR